MSGRPPDHEGGDTRGSTRSDSMSWERHYRRPCRAGRVNGPGCSTACVLAWRVRRVRSWCTVRRALGKDLGVASATGPR